MVKEGFSVVGVLVVGALVLGATAATAFWAFVQVCSALGC